MNIMVTGGAGFIGSHLCEQFISMGHNIICLDNFDDYYDPGIKLKNIESAVKSERCQIVEGDIRDTEKLDFCFKKSKVDLVVHLAARAGVRLSLIQPELYYDVNVVGTLRLLEAMRNHHVSKMIFASSSSVYGNQDKVPFSEADSVDKPISPYAASKKAGELLCHTYHHLYRFDIFCLRLFTVFGPRQRPEMAIYQFVKKLFNEETIVLYGDGTSQRDYTYVDDIVEGIVKSIPVLRGYEIINIGESRVTSLQNLIATIEKITGKKARIQSQPMQPGDVMATYADVSRALHIIGYQPKYTVEDGLKKFIQWFQSDKR